MPAPTTQQIGADFIVTAGGSTIGGRRGGTLTLSTDPLDASAVSDGYWDYNLSGVKSWGLQTDNLYLEGSTKLTGKNLKFRAAPDGTVLADTHNVEAVDNVIISLTADVEPTVNQSDAMSRAVVVVRKSVAVTVNYAWIDPAGAGGTNQGALLTAQANDAAIDWAVLFGAGTSISGQGIVTGLPLTVPHRGMTRMDGVTISPQGAIIQAGTMDTGLGALLTAFLADPPTAVATVLRTAATGATATGRTQFSGSAFATTITITISRSGLVTVAITLTGTGSLVRATTA